jgi:predicted RNase H-like HicB family nuclease
MIQTYIDAAMRQAHYELIQDDEPYYGEVPELPGVWATGRTLEECRQNLLEVVDGWLLFQIARGMSIPPLGDTWIVLPREMTLA